MGIENIIERLQDIDKIKLILFNENQRKLFALIPRPGVFGKNEQRVKRLSMKTILESKELKSRKDPIDKLIKDLNDEPMNRRMLELIGENDAKKCFFLKK